MLLRSLQQALHRDETGRRISDPSAGPLFGCEAADDDLESGTIYEAVEKIRDQSITESLSMIRSALSSQKSIAPYRHLGLYVGSL